MKKSDAIRYLEGLAMKRKREKYPNLPHHCLAPAKFTDQDSNGLTTCVIECFKLHDYFATRIDSKGTYSQALGRFIPSRQKKGLPDIFAQVPGMPPIWVEVKCAATRDRIRADQKETIDELRKTGAMVYIAQDFDSFFQWFRQEILRELPINS